MCIPAWHTFNQRHIFCLLIVLAFSHSSTVMAETAQNNYMLECQGCHKMDGSGTVESVPTLKNHMAKFLLVPGGREFLVQVPGSAQSPLSDQELTDTLNWMLSEFGPIDIVNRHPQYTVENVSIWRKTPLIEVQAVREKLIQAIATIGD